MRAVLIVGLLVAATVVPAQGSEREIWYVSVDAAAGGTGSATKPLATLSDVESNAGPGDTIVVLLGSRPLDGGIALKPGQRLVGDGAALTNTTTHLDGDAVRLADDTEVRGLTIVDPLRGGVYGVDVTDVRVVDNDVSGHNASCTPGFLIPQFNAPTNLPGVGVPIVGGLQNGWAGIMVDGSSRTGATAVIADNVVHDAECGDGVDVRTWNAATYDVRIERNLVHSLRQGPDFESLLAIGLQTRDRSSLTATVDGNVQRDLGNADDLNLVAEGADSEGVFVNGVGPSTIRATITGNRYTNDRGIGGFSANGLEMVTMGDGTRASVVVRDSYFSGSPGDVIEEGALGTNARLDLLLERVTAERSTGVGNTYVLPFNNGDCVLAGSLGAGNDVRLVVRDSILRQCSNNGLSVGSNVVNGTGPTRSISVEVSGSSITGNRGGNLGIRNFTPLGSLSVRVSRSDLAGSSSLGSSYADVAAENWSTIGTSSVSVGGSCLRGGLLALNVVRMHVLATGNWWGSPNGAGLLRTMALGGSADVRWPLTAKPAYCT